MSVNTGFFTDLVSRFAQIRRYLPGLCLLCQARCAQGLICQSCFDDLPQNLSCCACCAEPMLPVSGDTGLLCAGCQQRPPAFTQARAPFLYRYPLNELIPRFKRRDDLLLSQLMAQLILSGPLPDAGEIDLVVPVPSHWRSRLKRGFNPAAVLADRVAAVLSRPLITDLVVKTAATPAQHSLNRQQRLRNLADSFALKRAHRLQGKRILLVDDVLTTGSTAGVISALLRDNGAQSVQVRALARTPPKRM